MAYFDGSYGSRIAAYGFIVKNKDGDTIHTASGRAGKGVDMSSNVGEYEGLYQAMLYVQEHYPDAEVEFFGDSQLVITQMKGESKAKKGKYLPYYRKAIALAMPYIERKQWTFHWIGRALNSEADKLSAYRF